MTFAHIWTQEHWTMSRGSFRIPVKLHKNVTLIRTSEPVLADELLARKSLARLVLARLSDTFLLVKPDEADAAIEELRRMGHTPRIAR
jgi:ABC-type phosphate/phosphonate transport system substrate-binding protein